MINIAVCGSNGKMGQEVIKAVNSAEDMTLVAKIDIKDGEFATIKDAKDSVKIDILIDFTQPKSIYENALYCLNNGISIVIGTTGLNYYESGRDVGFSSDFYKSFEIYQNKCLEQYEKMKYEYNFISIDGTKSIDEIHSIMNHEVQKILDSGVLY